MSPFDRRNEPLTRPLRIEVDRLVGEIKEFIRLRWDLARLELSDAASQTQRLAIAFLAALLLVLVSLPVLVVAAAEFFGGTWGISRGGWLLIFGFGLLIGGLVVAGSAWFWFRRRFVGLRDTLEELREDAIWLREWAESKKVDDRGGVVSSSGSDGPVSP